MIELDDARLEAVLTSVGAHLQVEPAVSLAPRAGARPSRVRWALAVGAAVIVPLAVVVVAVAPLRHTVADWLGIGSTRVIIEAPTPTSTVSTPASTSSTTTSTLPAVGDGLPAIDADAAATLLGGQLPALDTSALGAPNAFARMPEGGVLVVWPSGETLWIHDEALPAGALFDKLVASSVSVRRVDDLGDDALAITGDHMLRTPHRTIGATTVVLWVRDDREFRLEGDHPPDDLVAIARELDASG